MSDRPRYNDEADKMYSLLRNAWETVIEETVLNQVVLRHRSDVQTKRLRGVRFTPELYRRIDVAFSRCCGWTEAHSKSRGLDGNLPGPSDVRIDIKEIDEFVTEIEGKHKGYVKECDDLLKPPKAEIG